MFIRIFGMFQKKCTVWKASLWALLCLEKLHPDFLRVFSLLQVTEKLRSSLLICFWGMPDSWSLSLLSSPYLQMIYIGESILLFFPFKALIPLSGSSFSRDEAIQSNSVEGIPSDFQGGSRSCILTVFLKFRSKSGLYHYSVKVELATFQRKSKSELKNDTGCIRQCWSGLSHLQEQTLLSPTT